MPGRDGTGPMGRGATSGRGLGVSSTENAVGYGIGLGLGRGAYYGCKRGLGRFVAGESVEVSNKETLNVQKEFLEKKLDVISKQLENK